MNGWYHDYPQIRADINRAGLSAIRRKYEGRRTGKTMFDRDLQIVKQVLRSGPDSCVLKFGISRQRADQILRKFWIYAKEIQQGRGTNA